MKRRDFLQVSAAGGLAAASSALQAAEGQGGASREYYEWRVYVTDSVEQRTRLADLAERAALPAWKRLGLGPIGVFEEIGEKATTALHLLLTFPRPELLVAERAALEADGQFLAEAADYLATPKEQPPFARVDSSWLVAFAYQPQLAKPRAGLGCYEMRTYRSYSEAKARRKIDMFNEGEIPIFRDCGFDTVFFGESLVGAGLPNLKYMLASPDEATHQEGWKKFISHPDWVAMRDLPRYADTVSGIDSVLLRPLACSEV